MKRFLAGGILVLTLTVGCGDSEVAEERSPEPLPTEVAQEVEPSVCSDTEKLREDFFAGRLAPREISRRIAMIVEEAASESPTIRAAAEKIRHAWEESESSEEFLAGLNDMRAACR